MLCRCTAEDALACSLRAASIRSAASVCLDLEAAAVTGTPALSAACLLQLLTSVAPSLSLARIPSKSSSLSERTAFAPWSATSSRSARNAAHEETEKTCNRNARPFPKLCMPSLILRWSTCLPTLMIKGQAAWVNEVGLLGRHPNCPALPVESNDAAVALRHTDTSQPSRASRDPKSFQDLTESLTKMKPARFTSTSVGEDSWPGALQFPAECSLWRQTI